MMTADRPATNRDRLRVHVNNGRERREHVGDTAYYYLLTMMKMIAKGWPPGRDEVVIPANTIMQWRAARVSGDFSSNAEIHVLPHSETGVYRHGVITFLIDGKECGCTAKARVERLRTLGTTVVVE
jgi:hypothetical protein